MKRRDVRNFVFLLNNGVEIALKDAVCFLTLFLDFTSVAGGERRRSALRSNFIDFKFFRFCIDRKGALCAT